VLKPEVSEEDKNSRLGLCALTAKTLKAGLGILGIETLEVM
jgi:arginyl-tRNA synthetase